MTVLITTDPNTNEYAIVLEYGKGGNMDDCTYLCQEFTSLSWREKHQIAVDITNGLQCLHASDIVHGALVSTENEHSLSTKQITDFQIQTAF